MAERKETYIGNSKLKNSPEKFLKVVLGKQVVKSKNIANGAVTKGKLGNRSVEVKNLDDDVQNLIASMEKGGVALSGEFGDSELIGINQKKLTETIGPEGVITQKVATLEEAVGEGGSIDERIATAKSELVDGASEEGDTFKKIEDRLSGVEESVGEGGSVDERIAVETNRAQAAEELLREAYASLSQSQVIPKTAEEWAAMTSWEEGVIYRVAGTTSYTDYMYNGTTTVPMATYDNAIDDEPTIGSDNMVKSSGIFFDTHVINDITPLKPVSKWSCSGSSYATFLLDDIGYNGTWNLLRKSSSSKRIYINCTNLKNGAVYKISFDFETSNGLALSTIGYGIEHNSTWKNLIDLKTGSSVNVKPGKIEFTFKKDETLNYLFISYDKAELTFPMTATVENFSIVEISEVTETVLNNKEDITLLKRKNIRSQYIEKENITDLIVFQTNDESVWNVDTSEEGTIVLTNVTKTGNTYCGFDISSIDDGTLIKFRFKTYADFSSGTIGAFVALKYQSWKSLQDVSGEVITKDEEGYLTIIFRKESSINWILFSSNSFSTGAKIGIRDYSLYTVKDLLEEIPLPDIYLPHVSSIIPPNYTYETYMSLNSSFSTGGSGQGSCVYENIFVNASTSNSSGEMEIKLYDLQNKSFLQSIVLTGITNVRTHANSITFGNKYDENDPLPLLYIPSGYIMSDTQDGQVYVYRFTGTIGELTATLVQIITLKGVNSWTEWICDANNNRAWVKSGANDFTCYNIPNVEESEAIIDETTPIIDNFTLPAQTYSSSVTKSSSQGHVYNKGRIWVCAGIPSGALEGPDACCIFTINVRSKCRESVIWLEDVGLINGTSNTYEPEGIFIWNNELYVAYRRFIAKIKKIDLV